MDVLQIMFPYLSWSHVSSKRPYRLFLGKTIRYIVVINVCISGKTLDICLSAIKL